MEVEEGVNCEANLFHSQSALLLFIIIIDNKLIPHDVPDLLCCCILLIILLQTNHSIHKIRKFVFQALHWRNWQTQSCAIYFLLWIRRLYMFPCCSFGNRQRRPWSIAYVSADNRFFGLHRHLILSFINNIVEMNINRALRKTFP